MNSDDYDALFPEVRYALTTDIAYSILLAKAAHSANKRAEAQRARRAAKRESDTVNVSMRDADDVSERRSRP